MKNLFTISVRSFISFSLSWMLFHLLTLNLFFLNSSWADYLILKKKPCNTDQTCVEPLALEDPHGSELYQILLDSTWPTSREQPLEGHEAERLKTALKSKPWGDSYQYIWIPNTLHELHCAATLLQQKVGYELTFDRSYKSIIREYQTEDFYAHTNEKLKTMIETQSHPEHADIDHYFDQLNERGKRYYLFCSSELTKFLIEHGMSDEVKKSGITSSLFKEVLDDPDRAQLLRSMIADMYRIEAAVRNERARSTILELNREDFNPTHESLLDQMVQLEIERYKQNRALLFRGTNGVGTLEGGLALDSAFQTPPRAKKTRNLSLSYGSSPFTGLFRESSRESSPQRTACPFQYMRSSTLGYTLSIDKNDSQIKTLFELPRLGMIGRLFASGEFFHPRSKVGTKDVAPDTQVSGLFPSTVDSVGVLTQLGIIVNPEHTSESLGNMIHQYLADQSILLSFSNQKPRLDQSESVHFSQQDLARRIFTPTSDYIEKVTEFVIKSAGKERVFSAALSELSRVRTTDERALSSLVDLLDHADPNIRRLAVSSLEMIAPENPKLRKKVAQRVEDKDEKVARAAINALKNFTPLDEKTTDVILSHLDNSALSQYHNDLIEIFGDNWRGQPLVLDPKIQKAIARKIGVCDNATLLKRVNPLDPKALNITLDTLESDSPKSRIAALEILSSQTLTEKPLKDVQERLRDKDRTVRSEAISTLRKQQNHLPHSSLLLLAQTMGDPDDFVRYKTSQFLRSGELKKTPGVFQELMANLNHEAAEVRKDTIALILEIDPTLSFIPEDKRDPIKGYLDQKGDKKIEDVVEKKVLKEINRTLSDQESELKG